MNIAITGSTGFIGRHLVKKLSLNNNMSLRCIVRSKYTEEMPVSTIILVDDLYKVKSSVFKSIDVVIHLSGLVHSAETCEKLYFKENVLNTDVLLQKALSENVKKIIYLSSISVYGDYSQGKLHMKSELAPKSAQAKSKLMAENIIKDRCLQSNMTYTILRSPLVYGNDAPANFGTLLKVTSKKLPLPLGAIRNKRSLVGIDNLIDLIITCIEHPSAVNQIFLVSDDHDVSTTELLREMAVGAGKPCRLIPVPVSLMQFAANLLGKGAVTERLFGSLQVDIEHTKKVLNWSPPISFSEGIRRCFDK